MRDLMGIMKQAQAMQEKMANLQSEMDGIEVTGASGGGSVRVGDDDGQGPDDGRQHRSVPDGGGRARDPRGSDRGGLQRRPRQGEATMQQRMAELTKDLPLPPGMKLPF